MYSLSPLVVPSPPQAQQKIHHWHGTAYGVPLLLKGMGIPRKKYPAWTKLICPYHRWFVQAGYPTWDEVGGHVGIPCLHQLPDMEEPIHIIRWILIFVFEPCAYLLKPHTACVLIEAEGGSSPNLDIFLWPPILLTPVSFAASYHQPHPQPHYELTLWHMRNPLRKVFVHSWKHGSLNLLYRK